MKALDKALQEHFNGGGTSEESFKAGWAARDKKLAEVLMGDKDPSLDDSFEVALQAYSVGFSEGARNHDQLLEEIKKLKREACNG